MILSNLGVAAFSGLAAAQTASRKVILDTDIADDVDDAYALALLLALPEAKVLGVTTAFGETAKRAEFAAKFLAVAGRGDIPVYSGRPSAEPAIREQYRWAAGYTSDAIQKESAVAFLKQAIEQSPGEVTLIAIGPLTNLGDLFTQHPEVKAHIGQIVIMGGAVHVDYNQEAKPVAEWNILCNSAAAKIVYESGVPLTMAGLEVTTMLKLDAALQKDLFAHGTPVTDALAALTNLWGNGVPTLFDPMAVAWALGYEFCDAEKAHVVVEANGVTRLADGEPNVTVLVKPRKEEFLQWYIERLKPTPKSPP